MGSVCWSLMLPLLLGAAQDDLPAGWKVLEQKEGSFVVKMPGMAMKKDQQVKTATGPLNVIMWYAEGKGDSYFVVSYSDFAEADTKKSAIEKRLAQARDGATDSVRGKVRSEKPIAIDGHPGRDIVIEKDGEVIAKMRIFLVRNRLYQVMVLGNGPVMASKDVGIFLDSFRLSK